MTDPTAASLTWRSPRSDRPAPDRRLAGEVVAVSALGAAERDDLFALLAQFFAGVTRERFERDLAEKDWVILLREAGSGAIRGFSTLMRMEAVAADRPVIAYFSGDTIIHPDCWGQAELPRTWARHALALAARERGARVYWFLISSGYKTYRFLPVFFREFWPRYDQPTPPEVRQVLDTLGQRKFGPQYNPRTGTVRFAQPTPLRDGVAEVTDRRLRDPHVAFFVQANPGHAQGDELACLTELSLANLTPAGRRMWGQR